MKIEDNRTTNGENISFDELCFGDVFEYIENDGIFVKVPRLNEAGAYGLRLDAPGFLCAPHDFDRIKCKRLNATLVIRRWKR